jgi:hypothetical protein
MEDEQLDEQQTEQVEAVPPTEETVSTADETKNAEIEALKAEIEALKAAPRYEPEKPKGEEDPIAELTALMFTDPEAYNRKMVEISTNRAMEQLAPAIVPTYIDHTTKRIAGEGQHAQEYARKLIQKGANTDDPEIADAIRRAARDYEREKTPTKVNVRSERSEVSAPTIDSSLRGLADQLAAVAGVTLSDAEIAEALAS